jgi:energy-coupling factor transport system permease protein
MTTLLIATTFFVYDWIVLGSFLGLVVGLILLAKIPMLYCLKKLKNPAIMIVIMLALQMLIAPYEDAILYGLLSFVRLMIVIISAIVLNSTTMPKEFILSFESFLRPVENIGMKTGSIILTLRIVQRFVPSIMREANKILNAQASRGLDIKGANIWMKMRLIGALLLPVFVVAIKRADDLSNSMAVRGYVINQKRTDYQTLQRIK